MSDAGVMVPCGAQDENKYVVFLTFHHEDFN